MMETRSSPRHDVGTKFGFSKNDLQQTIRTLFTEMFRGYVGRQPCRQGAVATGLWPEARDYPKLRTNATAGDDTRPAAGPGMVLRADRRGDEIDAAGLSDDSSPSLL